MVDALHVLQAAADTSGAYRDFPVIGSRAAIWIAAEIHLMFAAFVLGVPIFAVVAEAIGIFGKDQRYDRLAKEFTRLLLIAYSATAIWGAVFVFLLSTLYPRFWAYLTAIFGVSMWVYVSIFFFESFTLYLYYYGWDLWKQGRAKIVHWCLGILLNIWGTAVMFIADSWLTYMMTPPRDITPETSPTSIKLWHAILNHTWMPINIHRLIGNVVFVLGALVWGTPHTMIADSRELAAMGGSHHPLLGALGVMSAKNTAVNLMILSTFLSFLLYRRANIRQVVPWAKTGTRIQAAMFVIAAGVVLFFGIRGYFVEAIVRIGYSVYQVGAVLACIVFVTVIDVLMARGAQSLGAIQWGKMPPRSQYALFILAVTFTWLMGLMGFARSGIRQHWHVWQVMQDTTPYAATPALGYAAIMISTCVLIFLSLVGFIFWLGGLAEKSTFVPSTEAPHVGH